jgi:non-specific serine/threonine protein kinase
MLNTLAWRRGGAGPMEPAAPLNDPRTGPTPHPTARPDPPDPFAFAALKARFGAPALARAFRLARGGGVRRAGWDGDGTLLARVGTDPAREVRVRPAGDTLEVTCDCGVADCIHAAAVLLDLETLPEVAPGRPFARVGERVPWQVALHRTLHGGERPAPVPAGAARLVFRLALEEDGTPVVETYRAAGGAGAGPGKEATFGLSRSWGSDPLEPQPPFLSPEDVSLCRLLRQFPADEARRGQRAAPTHRFRPPVEARYGLLTALVRTGRLYLGNGQQPLVAGPARQGVPRVEAAPGGWVLSLPEVAASHVAVVCAEPPLYCDGQMIGGLLTPLPGPLATLLGARPLFIPEAERSEFLTHWLPALSAYGEVGLPEGLAFTPVSGVVPVPRLTLGDGGGVLDLLVEFLYAEAAPVAAQSPARPVGQRDGKVVVFTRDAEAEKGLLADLLVAGPVAKGPGQWSLGGEAAYDFLLFTLPALAEAGWEIFGEADLVEHRVFRGRARLSSTVSSGVDWFDLKAAADFDGTTVAPSELLKLWDAGRRYVRLEDGRVARIPDWIGERADALREARLDRGAETRLSRFQVPLLLELFAGGEAKVDAGFRQAAERLKAFSGVQPVAPPKGLGTALRPYQAEGLKWLAFLRDYGFHGILADDMGLGKTLQVIAILLAEKEAGGKHGPSLVVVPTSLIFNWAHELARFAPALNVRIWHGPDRHAQLGTLSDADVVLTNYALVRQDLDRLEGLQFHYLVVDEAQYIKNPESQVSRAVRALTARHRLALTGTPLENHLGELWAHFAFLMPGLLGSYQDFRRRFGGPVERGDQAAARALLDRVGPFILRRTKEQVASELPERVESVLYCRLEGAQRDLYDRIRDACRERVARSLKNKGLAGSRMAILDALLKLRQVCCHPELLPEDLAGGVTGSAKMDLFMEFVTESLEEGHRLLVFSQFVSMLRVIRRELDAVKVPYVYLDGRTRDREKRVQRFQESADIPLFLISLKAGGTGLNLTGADYVIHFDPWWNPAVEQQATDRAHRIGQTRKVFSYKLIAEDTVEEKILALQERKRTLSDILLGGERELAADLSLEDLEKIFGRIGD